MSLAKDYRDKSYKVRKSRFEEEAKGFKKWSRRIVRRVTKILTKLETRRETDEDVR